MFALLPVPAMVVASAARRAPYPSPHLANDSRKSAADLPAAAVPGEAYAAVLRVRATIGLA